MSVPAIRPAAAGDLPSIVALLADDPLGMSREIAPEGGRVAGAYETAFAAIVADPNQQLIVMEQAGRIVGTLHLTFIPGLSRTGEWRAQIEAVRIAAGRRGQGLGERLIGWAIGRARARGCGLVQLTTDASRLSARRFYERLGFVPSHVGMKLSLSPPADGPAGGGLVR